MYYRHDYAENDVIDAIVYRKPIALKAIYYLIEKRLNQGLSFPDPDFNNLIETNTSKSNYKLSNNENNSISTTSNTNNNNSINNHANNLLSTNVILTTNNSNGLTKQNSQLLPKRHNVQLAARSSSQKNVDFKSIFNNMNLNNSNRANYNESANTNHSNSPSPDFIAAAMSPIKTTSNNQLNSAQLASASSLRTSRQTNYQDLVNRKQNGSNNSINNIINNSNGNINNKYETISRVSATSYAGSQNDYKIDRYYMPASINNRMSPSSDEPYQPMVYFQPTDNRANLSSALSNNINNTTTGTQKNGTNGSIRSLPSSLYRGSPERSLPRSPDRQHDNLNNFRPTTSRVSSRPSDASEKSYDISTNQKYKVANYLTPKRSLNSSDEPGLERQKSNTNLTSNIVKNRQLHMGKAKIDLDTQPSNFRYFNK